MGLSLDEVLAEYRFYAGAKARSLDERYIRAFEQELRRAPFVKGVSPVSISPPSKTYLDGHAYPTPPSSDKGVYSAH